MPGSGGDGVRRRYSWVLGLLVAFTAAELFSAAGLLLLGRVRRIEYRPADRLARSHEGALMNLVEGRHRYIEHSPVLGWRVRNGGSSPLYRANSIGIRADREYGIDPPPGTLRIAAFGDSFTHGDDVENGEDWPSILERGGEGREVMNFGVPGYGLDQAFLRYLEEAVPFSPDVVLIGFMAENIGRSLSAFRPFYRPSTGLPLAKPRFRIDGEDLLLVPNPLARLEDYRALLESPGEALPLLGADDGYYADRCLSHPLEISRTFRLLRVAEEVWRKRRRYGGGEDAFYREGSEHLILTLRIFEEFRRAAIEKGSEPIILLFPEVSDIRRARNGESARYVTLLDLFEERGYRYVDLMETLLGAEKPFADRGRNVHYSPEGNRRIARRVGEELSLVFPDP